LPPGKVVTLLISDVPGDDPRDIASGPTVADASTCADALAIIQRYAIELPERVLEVLRAAVENPSSQAIHAWPTAKSTSSPHRRWRWRPPPAWQQAGITAHILGDSIEGEAREVGSYGRHRTALRGAGNRLLHLA
jgi:hydroxypyruvate reductase